MNRIAMALLASCVWPLAACTVQPTPEPAAAAPAPAPAPVTGGKTQVCNAEAAQDTIGKAATAEVVEQARKSAGAALARVLEPGQVVTMEYREDRLNLDVDAGNVITAVRCG